MGERAVTSLNEKQTGKSRGAPVPRRGSPIAVRPEEAGETGGQHDEDEAEEEDEDEEEEEEVDEVDGEEEDT